MYLFLHQLTTHNMTKDCSLNYKFSTWKPQDQKMLCTSNCFLVFVLTFRTIWCRGKYFSEALILASTNPQYDKRLFIELWVHYMKTTSSEHVVYTNGFCFDIQNNLIYTKCSECTELVIQWTIYCHIVDGRKSASHKDLLVCNMYWTCSFLVLNS